MYSPQPQLKRAPAFLDASSPTLHSSPQLSSPSLQSFISRTPPSPFHTLKPLPPDPPRSNFPQRRRSSSVYSRMENHWADIPKSWKSQQETRPYAFETPRSTLRDSDLEILKPVAYNHAKPFSGTISGHDSGIHVNTHDGSNLSMSPSDLASSVETMSLAEARVRARYPWNPPLLPEEMRQKAASHGLVTISTSHSKVQIVTQRSHDPVSRQPESPILGYDPRGRTTTRRGITRASSPNKCEPPVPGRTAQHSPPRSEAQCLARMYHSVIRDQSLPSSRGSSASSSDGEQTRTAMKMIPQPLFQQPRQIYHKRERQRGKGPHTAFETGAARVQPTWSDAGIKVPDGVSSVGRITSTDHSSDASELSPLSPSSDASLFPTTPILGRFASAKRVTADNSSTQPIARGTRKEGPRAAVRELFSPAGTKKVNIAHGTTFRKRRSVQMPSALKPSSPRHGPGSARPHPSKRNRTPHNTYQHPRIDVDHLKVKLGRVAGAVKPNVSAIVTDVTDMVRERAAEKKRAEMKRNIRVVPNEF